MTQARRCGCVALVGEPNAGKSTLMNRLVGQKVSAVTHKVQTTRFRIRGIATRGPAQLVFIDTPGLFRGRRNSDRPLVHDAWSSIWDSDIFVLLTEAHRGITPGLRRILGRLNPECHDASHGPGEMPRGVLAINKIDLVHRPVLLEQVAAINRLRTFEASFMISAKTGSGVEDLRDWLAAAVPHRPWTFPADQVADISRQVIAAEITREKLMLRLHRELPYTLSVETEKWETQRDGSIRIEQAIFVSRKGHRGIALGPKGNTVRAVGTAARAELRELLGTEVHLFLHVRVRRGTRGGEAARAAALRGRSETGARES